MTGMTRFVGLSPVVRALVCIHIVQVSPNAGFRRPGHLNRGGGAERAAKPGALGQK
jgi:hypothetical protein